MVSESTELQSFKKDTDALGALAGMYIFLYCHGLGRTSSEMDGHHDAPVATAPPPPLRYGCAFFLSFFLRFSFLYFILLNSLKYWQTNLGAQDAYQYTNCVCVSTYTYYRHPVMEEAEKKKNFRFFSFVFVQRAW